MKQVYCGFIAKDDGFNGPAAFDGPQGWTVNKMQQTEIFKVHHGLGLSNPHKLRIVATTTHSMTFVNIESMTANDFTVSVWTNGGGPAMTDVMFIAAHS